jgi:hypothetical protein
MATDGGILSVVGTLNNNGVVNAQAESVVTIDELINGVDGQLVGDGTIDADGTILNLGTISPGNSPGTLMIDQDLTLGSTSVFEAELAGLAAFDLLDVNGDVELGGELSLFLLDGFLPTETDTFDILSSSALTGTFSNVADGGTLQTTDGLGSFSVNYVGGNVQLSNFSAVPEPGTMGVLLGASLLVLSRRRRRS